MKQLFKYAIMVCVALACTLPLTSCDKDPEPDPKPVTPIDPDPVDTKAQLSSLEIKTRNNDVTESTNSFTFSYYSDNRISLIKEVKSLGDCIFVDFNWDPFSMTYNGKGIETTLSPEGYITSAYAAAYPQEVTTFEYDKLGHLTKVICSEKGTKHFYHSEKTFTWDNNLLVKIIESWQEEDSSDTEIWVISYGNTDNASGVWPAGFWKSGAIWFEPNDYNSPCVLQTGLLGVAPTKLPAKVEFVGFSMKDCEFTYTLNKQGYVVTEHIKENYGGSPHNYDITYTYR